MSGDILRRTEEYMAERGMLDGTEHILCALSGGADSVCLLCVLRELAEKRGFSLSAAHFHHGIRGEEADRDREFVEALCRSMDIPLRVGFGNAPAHAAARHIGLEEAARELRYAFLEDCVPEHGRIATAHHADDNAETVLLHLVRGTGLRGLCGIPPVRGSLIRPLLPFSRAELEGWLRERGIPWVEDSSNAADDNPRNVLRHRVLPVLRELNPSVSEAVLRMTETLSEDERFLEAEASELIREENGVCRLEVGELRASPAPVASRAFLLAAERLGVRLSAAHVGALRALGSESGETRRTVLPDGLRAVREFTTVTLSRETEEKKTAPFEAVLEWDAWQSIPGTELRVFLGDPLKAGRIYGKFQTFHFKKESICGNIIVRTRRAGDMLRPAGRNNKTLKKWMTEKRIPVGRRDGLPVFTDGLGVIAAAEIGSAERVSAASGEADCVLILSEGVNRHAEGQRL